MSDMTHTPLRDAALAYAAKGWAVLPLHSLRSGRCSCGKDNCYSVAKHPRTRRGVKDATCNEAEIVNWWSKWPDANIGIATGSKSGFIVLDVDDKSDSQGSRNLALLTDENGTLPLTAEAKTGRGRHLCFKLPRVSVQNSTSLIAPGLDVRAENGYIVAAPSVHASGLRYEWVLENEFLDVPEWLLQRMLGNNQKEQPSAEQNPFEAAPEVEEGSRNDTLHKLACGLRGQYGKSYEEITAILTEFNEQKCRPPLDHQEVLQIAESACKHPPETKVKKSQKRQEESPLYWFKLNTRHWLSNPNIILMTDYQTGWYIRLMVFAWNDGGFLPADDVRLSKLAGAKSLAKFKRECDLVLAEFEPVEMDGEKKLRHPKLVAEFAFALEEWMKKKKAGEASRERFRSEREARASRPAVN